ncbi:DUF489 family protein [Devosia albogilva]|uniref:DUF489 family protein n=1 Tax=Devosia albogilva TaxID=429726 RepID=A0ABW5QQG3_9HYPH
MRACLFTGLQLAHLWKQLGGSSWSMIFSKRKLLQDIQALARLQYQVYRPMLQRIYFYVYSKIKESV